MSFRSSVPAIALAAITLFTTAAGASERCLDSDCTRFALFETGEDATSTPATPAASTTAKRYGTWGVEL
ncbi:MAG TPA: hypothetical protein VGF69_16210, partial [Thermoanaerobaculia bacterium]